MLIMYYYNKFNNNKYYYSFYYYNYYEVLKQRGLKLEIKQIYDYVKKKKQKMRF